MLAMMMCRVLKYTVIYNNINFFLVSLADELWYSAAHCIGKPIYFQTDHRVQQSVTVTQGSASHCVLCQSIQKRF